MILIKRIYLTFFLLLSLTNCAIHPLPGDYSNVNTYQIITNIRCEAKDEVRRQIEESLLGSHSNIVREISAADVPDKLTEIMDNDLKLGLRFSKFVTSQIAYAFDFDITETDDNSGSLTFKLPVRHMGSGSLKFDALDKRTRKAKRVFTITDSFPDLARLDCRDAEQRSENFAYPIVGSVGMTEVMQTFLGLANAGGKNGNFTDTLTFTTEVKAGANPQIKLAPVSDNFTLAELGGTISKKRLDVHKLTIAIAFPPNDDRPVRSLKSEDGVRALNRTFDQATYLSCIERQEQREDAFNQLREIPPEILCQKKAAYLSDLANR